MKNSRMQTTMGQYIGLALLLTCLFPLSCQSEDSTAPAEKTQSVTTPAVQAPGDKGYQLQEIKAGLYWLSDGHYQMMFITTGQGVVAVDAPRSLGGKILAAIAEVTDEVVTHVIYSHYHADHIGATHVYPGDVEIIAQSETRRYLEEANDVKRPLPTITFDEKYMLGVGNQQLELKYTGPNHEVGNIIIYAPRQKVIMMVDIVWPGWVPFHAIGIADHVPGAIMAMDHLLAYDFDYYIGGHADRIGIRRDIELQKAYINDVHDAATQAYAQINFGKLLNEIGWQDRWRMFDSYFAQMAAHCSAGILKKWSAKL